MSNGTQEEIKINPFSKMPPPKISKDNPFVGLTSPTVKKKDGTEDIGTGSPKIVIPSDSDPLSTLKNNNLGLPGTFVDEIQKGSVVSLAPIEKQQFEKLGGYTKPKEEQYTIIANIIAQRQNPVIKYNNSKEFLQQDIDKNLTAVQAAFSLLPNGEEINKGIDQIKKDILDEGEASVNGNIPSITYANERKKQIDTQITDLKNAQYINDKQSFGSVASGGSLSKAENFDELQIKIDDLNTYKQHLVDYTDNIAKVQVFKATKEKQIDPNDPSSQITNHWGEVIGSRSSQDNLLRDIGMNYASLFDPIAVENKQKNLSSGADKNRNADLVAIENYSYERDGVQVSLDALDVLKAQGKIDDTVYLSEKGRLEKAGTQLIKKYPEVRIQNIKGALGQILDRNRDIDNLSESSPTGLGSGQLKSLWQNIINTGYGDSEVQGAIDELNKKGANITKQEAEYLINSKSDIGNTSLIGRVAGGLANFENKIETTFGLQSELDYENSKTLLEKHFGNTPNKATEQPQTIISTEGNKETNPQFLEPVKNPEAGLHNWGWGTVNLIADGVGTVAKIYALTELTGGLADELLGAEIGTKLLGYANDGTKLIEQTALSAAQKQTIGTVAGVYIDTYQDAKDASKNFIGDKEGGEAAREAYANLMGLANGIAWTILPANKIVQDIAGKSATIAAGDFAKIIPEEGLAGLKQPAVENFLVNTFKQTAEAQGKMSSISALTQVSQYAAQVMYNPQSVENRNLGQEVVDGALQGLSFLPITLLEGRGIAKNIDNVNNFQKEAIYRVASDPASFKEFTDQQIKDGVINQQQANLKISLINTMFDIRSKEVPQELSKSEKVEYANNLLFTRKLQQENQSIKDPVQTKINDTKIAELEKSRTEILNNSNGLLLETNAVKNLKEQLTKLNAPQNLIDAIPDEATLIHKELINVTGAFKDLFTAGLYNTEDNSIQVGKIMANFRGGGAGKITLHEATHAATINTIRDIQLNPELYTAEQRQSVKDLYNIAYDYTNNTSKGARLVNIFHNKLYGTIHPNEFIAEFVSNPSFRDYVSKTSPTEKVDAKKIIWDKVLSIFGASKKEVDESRVNDIEKKIDSLFGASKERVEREAIEKKTPTNPLLLKARELILNGEKDEEIKQWLSPTLNNDRRLGKFLNNIYETVQKGERSKESIVKEYGQEVYNIMEKLHNETQQLKTEVPLNKAKEIVNSGIVQGINGDVLKESILKGDDEFRKDLKDISEQANNPDSNATTIKIFGQDLVDIAQQLFPKEEVNNKIEEPINKETAIITVADMLDKKANYKGQSGTLYQDGQTVVFKIDAKNKEYELGNIDDIKEKPISDFGITHEESVVSINDNGEISVRGKDYINNFSDPLAAINRDADGNIISVNLETPDGAKRTFKGNIAEDIAYHIHLKEITKDNETRTEFEQFINEDERAREEINNAAVSEPATAITIEDNAVVSREKIESAPVIEPLKIEVTAEPPKKKTAATETNTTVIGDKILESDTTIGGQEQSTTKQGISISKQAIFDKYGKQFEKTKIGWNEVTKNALDRLREDAERKNTTIDSEAQYQVYKMAGEIEKNRLLLSEDRITTATLHLMNTEAKIDDIQQQKANTPEERSALAIALETQLADRDLTLKVLDALGTKAGRNLGLFSGMFSKIDDGGITITRKRIEGTLGIEIPSTEKELDANAAMSPWQKEKVRPYVKKIEEIKNQYEAKLKELEKEKPEIQKKERKKASNSIRDFAEKVRKSTTLDKLGLGDSGLSDDVKISGLTLNVKELLADALDFIADGIDKGEELAKLILEAAKKYKGENKESDFKNLIDLTIGKLPKIDGGYTFNDKNNPQTFDVKLDAVNEERELIRRQTLGQLNQLTRQAEDVNRKWYSKLLDWRRSFLIGGLKTLGRVAISGVSKFIIDPIAKQTTGRITSLLPGLSKESVSLKSATEGFTSLIKFKDNKTAQEYINAKLKSLEDASKKLDNSDTVLFNLEKKYGKNSNEYQKYQGTEHRKIQQEYQNAELENAKAAIYKWINGNGFRDAKDLVKYGSTSFEQAMGGYGQINYKLLTKGDKVLYYIETINRLHSVLKNPSARRALVETYNSKLENYQNTGEPLTASTRMRALDLAYGEFLSGKYQEKTQLNDYVNLRKHEGQKLNATTVQKVISGFLRVALPVAKVGVNIVKAGIDMSTVGVEGIIRYIHETNKGVKFNKEQGKVYDNVFKQLADGARNMSEKDQAYINKVLQRGLFGLGLMLYAGYAVSNGTIQYGGEYDDEHKAKRKYKGADGEWHELDYGEWVINGHPMGKFGSSVLNHLPEFLPVAMVVNSHNVYEYEHEYKGVSGNRKLKTSEESFYEVMKSDVNEITERLPYKNLLEPAQLAKSLISIQLAKDISEYFDKDSEGNLTPRKPSNLLQTIEQNVGARKLVDLKQK